MDRRYQVFISSTYADLKEERRIVMQAVLDLSCIPAGMELFPAADQQQFEYIKRVIDDSDYYVLVIGGRYGSITSEGISYTEKEYEYAVSRNLQVIAFLHEAPGSIAYEKSETDPVLRERLRQFREKVGTNRLIKPWRTPEQLASLVTSSLAAAIRSFPAVGWVRADKPANAEILGEINQVRKENERLREVVAKLSVELKPAIDNLAGFDEAVVLHGRDFIRGVGKRQWQAESTWREIFGFIAPYLPEFPNDISVKHILRDALYKKAHRDYENSELDDQDFKTVSVQLKALGLVRMEYSQAVGGGMGLFWSLTPVGHKMMLEIRTVRTQNSKRLSS